MAMYSRGVTQQILLDTSALNYIAGQTQHGRQITEAENVRLAGVLRGHIATNQTRVLTSHDPGAALAEADLVLALKDGRAVFVGEPTAFGEAQVKELYA